MKAALLSALLSASASGVTMYPPSERADGTALQPGELVECSMHRVDALGRRTLLARTEGGSHSWPLPLTAGNTRPVMVVARCTDSEGVESAEAAIRVLWAIEEVH